MILIYHEEIYLIRGIERLPELLICMKSDNLDSLQILATAQWKRISFVCYTCTMESANSETLTFISGEKFSD